MKHLLLTLAAIVCSCMLAGCDSTNGENMTVICPEFNPFDATFTIDDNGFCTLEGAGILSESEIRQMTVGYGWKTIGTYKVLSNGHLDKSNYWNDVIGGGTSCLWFVSNTKAVKLYDNNDPTRRYSTMQYTYDKSRGFLLLDINNTALTDADKYMQIVYFYDHGDKTYLYTMQRIAYQSTSSDKLEPIYGMVVYQRMTDEELQKAKEDAKYDADKENNIAVPESCKFRVTASYYAPDDGETSGAVIMAFRKVKFSLTDDLGTTMLPNPALEYFDSIVWHCNSQSTPGRYVIHRRLNSSEQTKIQWTTYFLDQNTDLVSEFDGYKDGRIAYTYVKHHDIYADKFLCYDWSKFSTSKPKEYTAACLLDPNRSFTVYEPRALDGDMDNVYAELRYNSEPKGKGNDINILEKEADNLVTLMNNHYSAGTDVGKKADTYRKMFKALPEKADIKMFWETADTRIALVLNKDELNAQNCYYYIHAEPKQ